MATSNKLSPKVAKANKLRIETNKTGEKLKSITSKWTAEIDREKDLNKRKQIDKKYNQLFEEADIAESKAYKKYYDYVKENFPKEIVATAVRKGLKTGKGFMGKTFINSLESAQKKRGKR